MDCVCEVDANRCIQRVHSKPVKPCRLSKVFSDADGILVHFVHGSIEKAAAPLGCIAIS